MHRFVVLSFAVALLISGCQGSPNQKDQDALQGTWIVVSMERNGEKTDLSEEKDEKKQITVTIKGTGSKMKLGDLESKDEETTFKLDATQKPKHIDMTSKKSEKEGTAADKKEKTTKCIYELDGDNLKICGPIDDDGERPKEFTGGKDKKTVLMTLKKKK